VERPPFINPWLSAAANAEPFEKTLSDQLSGAQAREALARVPEPYREILTMYFLQDFSYEAISKKLKIPQGTVMSRLFKARKLLQETWHEAGRR